MRWPSASLVTCNPSGLRTAGVPMTWWNTSEGKVSPLAAALANASTSSFLTANSREILHECGVFC
jgi:hypothetical protein